MSDPTNETTPLLVDHEASSAEDSESQALRTSFFSHTYWSIQYLIHYFTALSLLCCSVGLICRFTMAVICAPESDFYYTLPEPWRSYIFDGDIIVRPKLHPFINLSEQLPSITN